MPTVVLRILCTLTIQNNPKRQIQLLGSFEKEAQGDDLVQSHKRIKEGRGEGGLGQGLRLCTPNKLPGDADAINAETTSGQTGLWSGSSQCVVPGAPAAVSPECLLEMQILSSTPDLLNQKLPGGAQPPV